MNIWSERKFKFKTRYPGSVVQCLAMFKSQNLQMVNLQREASLLLYLVLTLVCLYLTIEVTFPFHHVFL